MSDLKNITRISKALAVERRKRIAPFYLEEKKKKSISLLF